MLFLQPKTNQQTNNMQFEDFTNIFLPHLIQEYVDGNLPLHALVDLDTWKKVFPEDYSPEKTQFHWYQVSFTCNQLKDGSILLTYILPLPELARQPHFAAIRLNLNNRSDNHVVYYVLRKPQNVDDQWDIHYLPFPENKGKLELKFRRKIEGTNSVRNFVYSVQQIPFDDNEYNQTTIGTIVKIIKNAIQPQD